MTVIVLRLGHRRERDARLSTHCGLIARAFGASEIIYSGERDDVLLKSIRNVAKKWGGPFHARYEENYRRAIKKHKRKKFAIVHLTMYGMPLMKKIRTLRKRRNVLVVIGSEKVPGEIYRLADYNIAVISQPHSEAGALAVFLHEYFRRKEKRFKRAKLRIIPQERGKKVVDTK